MALATCVDATASPDAIADPNPIATTPATATTTTTAATTTSVSNASPIRLLFAGDIAPALLVDKHLTRIAHDHPEVAHLPTGYPFHDVRARIAAADFAVGNLECVASEAGKPESPNLPMPHVPLRCPLALPGIAAAGFDLLSVANNHAHDFGRDGFDGTLRAVEAAGLRWFGAEAHEHRPQAPHLVTLRGVRIALLAYYNPPFPADDLARARAAADLVVVFNHWGQENEVEPLILQRKLGRELVDAGADLVVGTHAHVVQPTERHHGKLIVYGLGNFVFSGMTFHEPNSIGALLEVDVDPRTRALSARLQRVRLDDDGAPHLEGEPEPL
jgi:hypothetical protein